MDLVVGLGTSTSKEAKEYFTDMARHRIRFRYAGDEDDSSIDMAFSKRKIEDRKVWLTNWMAVSFLFFDGHTEWSKRSEGMKGWLFLYNFGDICELNHIAIGGMTRICSRIFIVLLLSYIRTMDRFFLTQSCCECISNCANCGTAAMFYIFIVHVNFHRPSVGSLQALAWGKVPQGHHFPGCCKSASSLTRQKFAKIRVVA